MLQIAITTRLNRIPVDTCVVALDRRLVVGDTVGSSAIFPGPAVEILPTEGGALIGSVTLRPGGKLTLDLGEVEVEFTVVRRVRAPRDRLPTGDIRLLVATGAMLILGLWADTATRWSHTPVVSAELEALPAMWQRFRGEPEAKPPEPLRVEAPEVQLQIEERKR